jgi:LemA protein
MKQLINNKWLLVLAILLVLAAIYTGITYNGLVKKQEAVQQTWNEMQNNYQRRLDLIPNLVSTVKANSDFEKNTIQQVAEARAKAGAIRITGVPEGEQFRQLEQAQAEVANSTNRLIAVIENYPELKATEAFRLLQSQLEGTERRVAVARKDFNKNVAAYNQAARNFPSSLVAKMLGFKAKEGFTADAGADKAPEIKF